MKKQLRNSVMAVILVLMVLGLNIPSAQASTPDSAPAALPNPGAMIPVLSGKYATYSGRPHESKFPSSWGIVNAGKGVTSSIDLGYSGKVVAPVGGYLAIMKDCGNHQVAVIRSSNGWAVALAHIYVNSDVRNKSVSKGTIIGKTVPPLAKSVGCGYGKGSHIHYTLMKWVQGKTIQYTEQNIVNTYLGPWIVKNSYLDGSKRDIKLGQLIK